MAWEAARVTAHSAATPLPVTRCSLSGASGLTLAEPIRALVARPVFDTAAMDGYAVAGTGTGPWSVRGRARAGQVWTGELTQGEAIEISTGAQVPHGATAVLPLEASVRLEGQIYGLLPERSHIRTAGEDTRAGTVMVAAGQRVTPAMIGLAASCGHDEVAVRPRPRVRVLVTGDELLHHGCSGQGRVRDALGPLLPALIDELGGDPSEVRFLPDHPPGMLAQMLSEPTSSATIGGRVDVEVVTGSTSVGVSDQLRRYLHRPGIRWLVDTVACRPGHPQLLAVLADGRYLVGLPGNPFAAFVAAHTLLGPLLAGLTARQLPPFVTALVTGDLRAAPGLTRLVPVARDGQQARLVGGHGSADLHGAAVGTALAVITPTWTDGAPAQLLPTG